jgi:NAD(P)-dependent dehydrogenase (short-subunit alcohol dehydrogenase family)
LALVTGAGREYGRAIALALGRAGARVVAVDLNPDAVQAVADAIQAAGGQAEAQIVDVGHKLAVQTMLYTLLDAHPRIDALVNAAFHDPRTPALRLDEAEWNRTLDVTLKGAFLMAQTVARAMQVSGGGVIVNVLRPVEALPAVGRAAQAGLAGLTSALRAEWAPLGVRVESVLAVDPEVGAAAVLRLLAGPIPDP